MPAKRLTNTRSLLANTLLPLTMKACAGSPQTSSTATEVPQPNLKKILPVNQGDTLVTPVRFARNA
ncbi:MAG: hypothetical protein ACRC47_01460 [Shewanella sp.]